MEKQYFVYLLASKKNGTLYKGITSNLQQRIWQHKNKVADGFTQKYDVTKLVYFETYDDPENAIKREKRLLKYTRAAKIKLIEKQNPNWNDLYDEICN
ncbi:MAG: GIY-YIG nuclease family protein [Alphaproteobacteria bacterium]